MLYALEFRPYRRKFKQPLTTSHGVWEYREGIILKLTDKLGNIGLGEIAPLEWFASENFQDALNFCASLDKEITSDTIYNIPSKLPACQFGFESAAEDCLLPLTPTPLPQGERNGCQTNGVSGLLPTGKAALDAWSSLWDAGYRTFKWKIGIASVAEEITIFERLMQELPPSAKLRLDANGGLNLSQAIEWLKVCDCFLIEFVEQPLAVTQFNEMLELSERFSTPIALDESVANLTQLKDCYQNGWRDIFVIKPAIFGSPKLLSEFIKNNNIDTVFSSVFETPIGQSAGLKLANELSKNNRAVGFGLNHWFSDNFSFDELWTHL